MNTQFYSLDKILEKNAHYNIVFGERSNGKTYAALEYGLKQYTKYGHQMGYIRRWKEDMKGKRGKSLFDGHVANNVVSRLTNGKYTDVYYYAGNWYLAYKDRNTGKLIPDNKPFCTGFALSEVEHDKSTSYPNITTIVFDEFLTRNYYLPDEFVTFMNVVSTIVRHRDNVKIFMLGNTVNRYSPYFIEMGLTHIAEMKKASIDVYQYGDSKLRVAVEYSDSINKDGKASDVYFAFDNPKLAMITGGVWEMAMYPHLPFKYEPSNIIFTYFIYFNDNLLQCEVVAKGSSTITYVHRKTTPLRSPDKDIVFQMEEDPRPNYFRSLQANSPIANKLFKFYKDHKVFYQDNEVGEVVRNYITQCQHDKLIG